MLQQNFIIYSGGFLRRHFLYLIIESLGVEFTALALFWWFGKVQVLLEHVSQVATVTQRSLGFL